MLELTNFETIPVSFEAVQITEETIDAVADLLYAVKWGIVRTASADVPTVFWIVSGMLKDGESYRPPRYPMGSWLVRDFIDGSPKYQLFTDEEFKATFRKPKTKKK